MRIRGGVALLCRAALGLVAAVVVATTAQAQTGASVSGTRAVDGQTARQIERGRYLVLIGGCNDCHTPGYGASGGTVPEKDWLTGDSLGFSGPWGTTYPSNLRQLISTMTQQDWLKRARSDMRPPMPAPSLHHMRERDLKAIYRFIVSLGPKGEQAPAYLPPGSKPMGPVVVFPSP